MKDVVALSNGETRLSVSTLYEALSRLLDQGMIERIDPFRDPKNRRERKTYRLTQLGREVLGAETKRMRRLVDNASLRMSGDQL
jgi:DNA-binding PadR family transcriptional regulator